MKILEERAIAGVKVFLEDIELESDYKIYKGLHKEGRTAPFHTHEPFEISFVIGGKGNYEYVENENICREEVQRGTLGFWNKGVAHRSCDLPHEPLEQIILYISPLLYNELLLTFPLPPDFYTKGCGFIRNPAMTSNLLSAFHQLLNERDKSLFMNREMGRAILIQLFIELERNFKKKKGDAEDERVITIMKDLEEHICDPLTLTRYSDYFGLSERRLQSLFKKMTGLTFNEYLCDRRLNEAYRRLSQNHDEVILIAFSCGFRNISWFNRKFKEKYGVTPTDVRYK